MVRTENALKGFCGLAALLFAAAVGCSTSPPEELPPPQPITGDPDEPVWVARPWSISEEGILGTILYAVGYAPENPDLSVQMEIARSRARDELARIVGSLVTAVTRDVRKTYQDFAGTADSDTNHFAVIQSEVITQELIQGSRQVDGWRDRQKGYWALLKLPLSEVSGTYKESLLGSIQRQGTQIETLRRIQASTDKVLDQLLAKNAAGVRTYLGGRYIETTPAPAETPAAPAAPTAPEKASTP
jgi:hypothetical protein